MRGQPEGIEPHPNPASPRPRLRGLTPRRLQTDSMETVMPGLPPCLLLSKSTDQPCLVHNRARHLRGSRAARLSHHMAAGPTPQIAP